jgi:uncharacterized protein involved in outer membrane biogenesis
MKAIKILSGLVVVLVVVIAIVITLFLGRLNGIVERVIEKTGTQTLQVAVDVGSVDIQLAEGKGSISKLTIANPSDFSRNDLLTVGGVGLQIDTGSLASNVKVIKDIYLNGVQLRVEQKNISDTNIQALIDNLKKSAGGSSSSSSTSSDNPDIRLMIEQVRVGETIITLETEKYGSRTVTLPGYSQANIGNKRTGLTPEQIVDAIVSNLLSRAKTAVKEELKTVIKDKADDKVKEKLKDSLSSDKLKSLFK